MSSNPGRPAPSGPFGERTRAEVFALILTDGPLSRVEVAAKLGLSPSTVTRLLPPLLDGDYIRETGRAATALGRPRRLLEVNAARHLVVGVKISPTHVTGVLTDMAARVVGRAETPVPDTLPTTILRATTALTRDLLSGVDTSLVLGIGVGVGGHVGREAGICHTSALLDWHEVPVAAPLAEATGLPVVVENDVNTLVVAERWFGAGRDTRSFAVVTIGPGVGCGLLLGGAMYTGATGMAGEFGHLPLDPAGPKCLCGNHGCLEALASSAAIVRDLAHEGVRVSSAEQAAALARAGNPAAREVYARVGNALGRGLAALVNLLDLELIVLAGEGAAEHDLFGPAMTAGLRAHAFSKAAERPVHIDPATDDLWARGAACLMIGAAVAGPLTPPRVERHHP
ncbi:ROK family transcriptional regulator [Phytomonospora endophytica]|uniref:Putative NBD/HSP70 family sugar kinase n=1 Tax=Phytomonospora endophytica TaxID=714109 RepID=A0A841FS18_9ACTN|nr:ROK family transcriptional regulator [Phytomonospora endophytica]MBB6038846.1 putative NBD/HSP70 family sugar kinase [Phytomonospora endophytica]GIG68359.1 sugar kinase [Phytomonospora endophytica]